MLEFGHEDWMTPQRIALGGGTGKVLFQDAHLGTVELRRADLAGPWRRVWFDWAMPPAGGAGLPSASHPRQEAK